MLQPGLYEQVINEKIDKELSCVANARKDTEKIADNMQVADDIL